MLYKIYFLITNLSILRIEKKINCNFLNLRWTIWSFSESFSCFRSAIGEHLNYEWLKLHRSCGNFIVVNNSCLIACTKCCNLRLSEVLFYGFSQRIYYGQRSGITIGIPLEDLLGHWLRERILQSEINWRSHKCLLFSTEKNYTLKPLIYLCNTAQAHSVVFFIM